MWAANLKDTLGLLFVVASFAAYASRKTPAAIALFVLGLLAKSTFFPLALLFGASEFWRGERPLTAVRRSLPFVLPAFGVAVTAALLRRLVHLPNPEAHGFKLGATALFTPFWYLGRILVPLSPEAVYDFAWVTPGSPRFFVALGLWALVGVALWRSPARFRRGAWLLLGAYILSLAPVSGLVPLAYPVQDRYSVWPALALFSALAVVLLELSPRALSVATVVALGVCVPLNILRQRDWESGINLWEENARATPNLWPVRVNLANAYAGEARWPDAIRELEAAMALRPEKSDALGELFYFHGALEGIPLEDLKTLRGRLAFSNFSSPSLLEAGRWCVVRGYFGSARPLLERIRGREEEPEALRLLAAVERHDRHFEASAELERRSVARGDELARVELVYALTDLGRGEEALVAGRAHLSLPLHDAQLRAARAYALMHLGRTAEGQAEARAAMEEIQARP